MKILMTLFYVLLISTIVSAQQDTIKLNEKAVTRITQAIAATADTSIINCDQAITPRQIANWVREQDLLVQNEIVRWYEYEGIDTSTRKKRIDGTEYFALMKGGVEYVFVPSLWALVRKKE